MKHTIEVELDTEVAAEALKIAVENIKLFDEKQKAYGSQNISIWGKLGVAVRITDKAMRLNNLIQLGIDKPMLTESVEDSFADISNYGLIGQLLIRGLWK